MITLPSRSLQAAPHRRTARRAFLRGSAAMVAAGLWPGGRTVRAAVGNAKAEPFDFAVVNDTHYRDDRCRAYLEKAFAQITAGPDKPEFILLAGDLATDGRKRELEPMRDLLSALDCPVYVTPGNHDYEPDKSGAQYDALFPGRRNYAVEHKGWTILSFDSTLHTRYKGVAVQPETLAWLDETLPGIDRGRPLIVFTHFPLGRGVRMRSTNADAVLDRFREHNLRAVFTGHFHGLTERKHGDITICGNRCLAFSRGNHDGSKQKGYFQARAEADRVAYAFREFRPAP